MNSIHLEWLFLFHSHSRWIEIIIHGFDELSVLCVFWWTDWMILVEQLASLIFSIHKNVFFLSRPLSWACWVAIFFLYPTQRNSPCSDTKHIVKVFSYNPCPSTWIGYLIGGSIPFVFSTRTEFLCTRANVFSSRHFLFNHFIFLLWKKQNTKYQLQFLLHYVEVFSIYLQMRVIWR